MSATTTACFAATTAVAACAASATRAPASRTAGAVRPRRSVVARAQESSISEKLELTAENVELVLDEVRRTSSPTAAMWSSWRSTGWWCV